MQNEKIEWEEQSKDIQGHFGSAKVRVREKVRVRYLEYLTSGRDEGTGQRPARSASTVGENC